MTTEATVEVQPEINLDKIRSEIRAEELKKAEARFEAWKAKELANLEETQRDVIAKELQKLQAKIQEEQKPLTKEAIQQLVDQEYAEIAIKLPVTKDDGSSDYQNFVIRELPQSVERKFYRQFKDRVKDKGSELAAFAQKSQEESFEKTIVSFLETFDGAFDILTDAVALILNPFGKIKDLNGVLIDSSWVANNVSSNRCYSIILAQVEVNKLRDFFSRIFASGQRAQTILMPPNLQSLRQLAR